MKTNRIAPEENNDKLLEQKHREGYIKYPVRADEFSVWESEQAWGDSYE